MAKPPRAHVSPPSLTPRPQALPSEAAQKALAEQLAAFVAADLPVILASLSREDSDARYGTAPYWACPPAKGLETFDLVAVDGWVLAISAGDIASTTGALGRVEITKVKYMPKNREVQVQYTLHPLSEEVCLRVCVPASLRV